MVTVHGQSGRICEDGFKDDVARGAFILIVVAYYLCEAVPQFRHCHFMDSNQVV